MNNKYTICHIHICALTIDEFGYISPNLNQYPETRLCVIDNEKGIAIDVYHELQYDYLQTASRLFFINGALNKFKENKRVAIFPYQLIYSTKEEEKRANDIIQKLESGYIFSEGNEVLSNEEYLKRLDKEKEKNEIKSDNCIKKLIKRKK